MYNNEIQRFQALKNQLEHFREATDPRIAVGLGIEGPTSNHHHNHQYQQLQPPSRDVSVGSTATSSTILQPPGLFGTRSSSSRGPSTQQSVAAPISTNVPPPPPQQQHQQQPIISRPPTVIQADGSFRFLVPAHHLPPPPQQQQQNFEQPVATVSLRQTTNPQIFLQQQQQQQQQQQMNAVTPQELQNNNIHAATATAGDATVGRSLFDGGNNQQQQNSNTTSSPSARNTNNSKRVSTEERPPWIGPLDPNANDNHGSTPGASLRQRRQSGHSSSRSAMSPTSTSRARSGNKYSSNNNDVLVIQDGRKIVYRGSTHKRLTEETLYTGQSKIRFAWKQADFLLGGEHGFQSHSTNGYVAGGGGYTPKSGDADDSEMMFDQMHHQSYQDPNESQNYLVDDESALLYNNWMLTPNPKIRPLPKNLPQEPKVLELMAGTSIAAEQRKRARTEGERRTAETLMRRQAWKALHPGAMDWQEKTWNETLRAGARSSRGGADSFDDAKHFTLIKKERPQWRFPAREGPTLTQLREAPVVVNVSLEDLKVTPVEERVLEHIASQRRYRSHKTMDENKTLMAQAEHALVHAPTVTRCDAPPNSRDEQYLLRHHQQHVAAVPENSRSGSEENQIQQQQRAKLIDASNFAVRNENSQNQNQVLGKPVNNNNNQWSASPVPQTPRDISLSILNKTQNQQNNNKNFVLPSRAARDAMASFGDPSKTISLSGQVGLNYQQQHQHQQQTNTIIATRGGNTPSASRPSSSHPLPTQQQQGFYQQRNLNHNDSTRTSMTPMMLEEDEAAVDHYYTLQAAKNSSRASSIQRNLSRLRVVGDEI